MKKSHWLSGIFFGLCLSAVAATRTGTTARVTTETFDAGGGRLSGGASIVVDAGIGEFSGIASGVSTSALSKNGYVGQLTDLTDLQVSAFPTTVAEGASRQLAAAAAYDDGTLDANPMQPDWSVASGPLASVDSGGLALASNVYQDTSAAAQGILDGLTGRVTLLVLNTNSDDFGLYAMDGLDDSWQVGYFGVGNTNAAPDLDVDGDGFDNLGEYIADTVPTNLFSFLRIIAMSNQPAARLVLVPSSPNRAYALDAAPDLLSGPWSPVPGQTNVPGTGSILAMPDTGVPPPTAHYRVRAMIP